MERNVSDASRAEVGEQLLMEAGGRPREGVGEQSRKRKLDIRRVRGIVALVVFASIAVGLALHTGWGTLSSMGVRALAVVCPLGAFETLVAGGLGVPRLVVVVVVMIALVGLFGRFFCGWICPVPPVQNFFLPNMKHTAVIEAAAVTESDGAVIAATASAVVVDSLSGGDSGSGESEQSSTDAPCADTERSRKNVALAPCGGKRDGVHLDSRHGVLVGALLSSAVFGFPVFCLICPVGLTIATFIALWEAVALQTPTVSLLVFPAILAVELLVFKKWCHVLCPLGALMSLIGAKSPVLKPHVDSSKCLRSRGIDCKTCTNACPEQLDPHSSTLSECTRCGECVGKCPAAAVVLKGSPPNRQSEAPCAAVECMGLVGLIGDEPITLY